MIGKGVFIFSSCIITVNFFTKSKKNTVNKHLGVMYKLMNKKELVLVRVAQENVEWSPKKIVEIIKNWNETVAAKDMTSGMLFDL